MSRRRIVVSAPWSRRWVDATQPTDPHRYLREALSWLRWATILVLLLLTLVQPATGRSGLPTWALLLLFAGYHLLLEGVQRRFPASRSTVRDLLLDLPVAGLVYALGAQPGGPLFVLFVLAVVCAAASLTLRGTLLYTAAAAATVVVIEPTLPFWSTATGHIRELGARVVGLGVVAIGTTILARRLALEEEVSRSSRGEAERLAELDRLRADFVASVSHDLQTPLAATRVSLGLLDASAAGRVHPARRGRTRRCGGRCRWKAAAIPGSPARLGTSCPRVTSKGASPPPRSVATSRPPGAGNTAGSPPTGGDGQGRGQGQAPQGRLEPSLPPHGPKHLTAIALRAAAIDFSPPLC